MISKDELRDGLHRMLEDTGIDPARRPGAYAETGFMLALAQYLSAALDEPSHPAGYKHASDKDSPDADPQDYLLGTDQILSDQPQTSDSGRILRLDFTMDFDGKDFMPLATRVPDGSRRPNDPRTGRIVLGNRDYLRFGLRIGNGRYGFQDPVVVVGLCSADPDRGIGPDRLREDIGYMYDNITEFAPDIILAASRTRGAYRYLSSKAFRSKMDEKYKGKAIGTAFPQLECNGKSIMLETPNLWNRRMKGKTRVCRATVCNRYGELKYDNTGDLMSVDIPSMPWKTKSGHKALLAAKELDKGGDPEMGSGLDLWIDEPVRDSAQPYYVVTENLLPPEEPANGTAISRLTDALKTMYGGQGRDGGPEFG